MDKENQNKISISKDAIMESFTVLYHTIKDYSELINEVNRDDGVDVKKLVQDHISRLEFGSTNVKGMELIGAYLKFTLDKFKGEKLTFLIPDDPQDDYFRTNSGYLSLSKNIDVVEGELREIEEKVFYISKLLPPNNIEKISVLLKAISSFFKSIVRKDMADMEGHINYIHHLTASKESYFLINDIGRMVRDIHNTLNDFSSNISIDDLGSTVDDMPDAIDKLNLVIQRMEGSANSTLDNVENLLDKNSKEQERNAALIEQYAEMEGTLTHLADDHPEINSDLSVLVENIKTNILNSLNEQAQKLKEEESTYFDIISAQSFQDITGQTLKKIIGFIEQLEFNLLQILQKYGGRFGEKSATENEVAESTGVSPLVGTTTQDGLILTGPQDNKTDEESKEVTKQADVDKMLAEFGF